MRHLLRRYENVGLDTFIHPIFGEGAWHDDPQGYAPLYDFHADGILRAYEEVLGVRGEDYKKIRIGLGGVALHWQLDPRGVKILSREPNSVKIRSSRAPAGWISDDGRCRARTSGTSPLNLRPPHHSSFARVGNETWVNAGT